MHFVRQLRQGAQNLVHALPAHQSANGQHQLTLVFATHLGPGLVTGLRHIFGLGAMVGIEDPAYLFRSNPMMLHENLPQKFRTRDDPGTPRPPTTLQESHEAHLPAIGVILKFHNPVPATPTLAVRNLPRSVHHDADHNRLAAQLCGEHMQQGQVLVHIDHISPARSSEHGPKCPQIAQG